MVAVVKDLLRMKQITVVEGAACSDHIPLSIRIPPKYSVSEIVGYLKGKSALVLYDRHPEWRRRIGKDRTFWARGWAKRRSDQEVYKESTGFRNDRRSHDR